MPDFDFKIDLKVEARDLEQAMRISREIVQGVKHHAEVMDCSLDLKTGINYVPEKGSPKTKLKRIKESE